MEMILREEAGDIAGNREDTGYEHGNGRSHTAD